MAVVGAASGGARSVRPSNNAACPACAFHAQAVGHVGKREAAAGAAAAVVTCMVPGWGRDARGARLREQRRWLCLYREEEEEEEMGR